MTARQRGAFFLLALLAAACGDEKEPSEKGGAMGSSGGGGSGGGSSVVSTVGAGGDFNFISCSKTDPCPAGRFCDFEGDCGTSHEPGDCNSNETNCPDPQEPVCGCDGTMYESRCDANAAGVDVSKYPGACEPPRGTFACGPHFCVTGEQFCERWIAPVTSWACTPLPDACKPATPPPDCTCFGETGCGCELVDGNFTLVCATE